MTRKYDEQIEALRAKAESGADWAEICRLEAEAAGGPFYCPTCGCELTDYDTSPCDPPHPDAVCPIAFFN